MKRKLFHLIMMVLVTFGILTGCQEIQTLDNDNSLSGETHSWTLSTPWPESMFLQELTKKWAEEVNKSSGGRLKIEVHPDGAIVAGGELMDAAHNGIVDAYHAATNMWMGRMDAAPLFTTIPMIMDTSARLSWTYEGGGLELWQKMYDEEGLNIQVVPLGITGPEVLAWSNADMSNLEDWKGLKYRGAGIWAEILRNRDVSVTTVPAGEVYQSLERGLVDAAEFSTPGSDRTLSLYEVTDYYTGPGIHQPSTMYYLGINKEKWNELPEDLQNIVMQTAQATTLWTYINDLDRSIEANEYYLDQGIKSVTVDKESQEAIQEDVINALDQQSEELGGIFEETWNSIKEYREKYGEYKKLMVPETE